MVAGNPLADLIVIDEEDQYGNIVATDNTTQVTALLESGSGTLIGSNIATVENGVASFDGLEDDTAGALLARVHRAGSGRGDFTHNHGLSRTSGDHQGCRQAAERCHRGNFFRRLRCRSDGQLQQPGNVVHRAGDGGPGERLRRDPGRHTHGQCR